MIFVTGGAGFIGSNFVLHLLTHGQEPVVNLDKLTYAGNLNNLKSLQADERHIFVHGDIADRSLVSGLLEQYRPRAIVNFAAESHVDRSIHGAAQFITTNVVGTFELLEAALAYYNTLSAAQREHWRFVHVSTDEVYGSLLSDAPAFTELHRFEPNSPYSASKAASDHLVRAWHHTYALPTITTHCSNNYGPYQFPEKLIALMIVNALARKPLPIYGDGRQVRDWLYVQDHCQALSCVLDRGRVGQTYNIGGNSERTNIDIVQAICAIVDELAPREDGHSYERQIVHVTDRPGHDRRYAIDTSKIERELGWHPQESLLSGLRKTVKWYLDNPQWVAQVQSGDYRSWIDLQYGALQGSPNTQGVAGNSSMGSSAPESFSRK